MSKKSQHETMTDLLKAGVASLAGHIESTSAGVKAHLDDPTGEHATKQSSEGVTSGH